MKKSILVLLLSGVLTVGGTLVAFADDISERFNCSENKTTGVQCLINEGMTVEEAKEEMLNRKFERVDKAAEEGTITSERAEEIKNRMKSNSEACTTPGEGRANGEGYGLNKETNCCGDCNNLGKGRCKGHCRNN